MLRYFYLPVCICLMLAISTNVNAQLTVDNNLGTLSFGTTSVSGNTATGTNQVDHYGNPNFTYNNENVYQFTVAETVFFDVSSVAITGDPDFFLLNGNEISTDIAGRTFAQNTNEAFFLDPIGPNTPPVLLTPGTYFLAASAFDSPVPVDATYSIEISLDTPPPIPPATNLGNIADTDVAFTIDTFGSVIADPELAIWTEDGALLGFSDAVDFPNNLQAELDFFGGLPEGTYVLAVAGFDTFFADGFVADGLLAQFSGNYTLNYSGQTTTGTIPLGVVDFYTFSVGGFPLGDVDLSGTVDFLDIRPFIGLLTSGTFQTEADINQDLAVDFLDIRAFIGLLSR